MVILVLLCFCDICFIQKVLKISNDKLISHYLSNYFDLTAVGSRLARGTSHMWDKPGSACGCVRCFSPGYSGFRTTYRLIRLDMSEKLERDVKLNQKKKKKKKKKFWSHVLKPSISLLVKTVYKI